MEITQFENPYYGSSLLSIIVLSLYLKKEKCFYFYLLRSTSSCCIKVLLSWYSSIQPTFRSKSAKFSVMQLAKMAAKNWVGKKNKSNTNLLLFNDNWTCVCVCRSSLGLQFVEHLGVKSIFNVCTDVRPKCNAKSDWTTRNGGKSFFWGKFNNFQLDL